jgi:hypothetical protein
MAVKPTPFRVLEQRIKNRKLPHIEPPTTDNPALNESLGAIRDHLLLYEGNVQAPKERFVTLEELEAAGVVGTTTQRGFASITNFLGEPVRTVKSDAGVKPLVTAAPATATPGSTVRFWDDLEDVNTSGKKTGSMPFWNGGNWDSTESGMLWVDGGPDDGETYLELAYQRGINWLDSGDTSVELLIFDAGGTGAATMSHFDGLDASEVGVSDDTGYTTAHTITGGSSITNGDQWLMFASMIYDATTGLGFDDNTVGAVRIQYGGNTIVSASCSDRDAFSGSAPTEGHYLAGYQIITGDGTSDFTSSAITEPAPNNDIAMKYLQIYAINLTDLGASNWNDYGSVASGSLVGNTEDVYADVGDAFTIGDGESDYLLILELAVDMEDTIVGNVPDWEAEIAIDGGPFSTAVLTRLGGGDEYTGDQYRQVAILGLEAPANNTSLQMQAKWESFGFDSDDGSVSIAVNAMWIKLNAFAQHHINSSGLLDDPANSSEKERLNTTFTSTATTGEWGIFGGFSEIITSSGFSSRPEVRIDIDGGGDTRAAGDQDTFVPDGGAGARTTGVAHMLFPHGITNTIANGEAVEMGLFIVPAPSLVANDWYTGVVAAFTYELAPTQFVVGDDDYTTHIDGSLIQLDANTQVLAGATFRVYDSTDTDYMQIDHDGTDANISFASTTDLDITDLTAINLLEGIKLQIWDSTDVDHGDLYHDGTDFYFDFTTTQQAFFQGVTASYQFDETVAIVKSGSSSFSVNDTSGSAITAQLFPASLQQSGAGAGDFFFTGMDTLRLLGGKEFHLVDSTSSDWLAMSHNGTDVDFDYTNTTNHNFNDGVVVKIWDATNNDNLAISHDGTDANITGTQTTDLNFSGFSAIDFAGPLTSITDIPDGIIGFEHANTDLDDARGMWHGAALDSPAITVTESGGTVSLNLEKSGTGDIRYLTASGVVTHDTTPIESVALTAGTDTSPQINYVYILHSNDTLTVNTGGWPAGVPYTAIATVLVQSAASLATDGAYKVHAWTDHVLSTAGTGHISDINFWIRQQPASWVSGVALTPTVGAATFDIATTAGVILQLHDHDYPAFDTSTGSEIMIVNQNATPYDRVGNLVSQITDSTGTSMANKHYNLVIWGVVSEDASDCQLMVNLPSDSYTSAAAALVDSSGTANYDIPTNFTGTGFLIARLTVKHANAGNTYTINQNQDLRGLDPSIAAGGSGSGLGVSELDELSDVTTSGLLDDDILFLQASVWVPSAGLFTWDGSKVSITDGSTWSTDGLHVDLTNQAGFLGDDFGIKIYAGGGRYIAYWDDTGLVGQHQTSTPYIVMDNAVSRTDPGYSFRQDNSTGIGQDSGGGEVSIIATGVEQARFVDTGNHLINSLLDAATGNEIALDLNYTTNKVTSGDDTGLRINATDTASPGTSLFAEFVVGGVTKFSWSTNPTFKIYDDTGVDSAAFSHDGTDFNTTFPDGTTTDWNISGITAIQAGTVDADFDAITATSYGGITEANLFDKSADNVIATTLDASTGNEIAFDLGYTVNKATSGNDTGLRINVTDTASPGTSLFAEFVVGGVTKFSWSTNPTFTIFDDTGADSVAMSHDGTDFNMAFTNTTAINITGATDLEFPDAFAINSAAGDYWTIDEAGDPRIIIDHIDSRFTVGDGYRLRIRDSGNTDHADFYHDGTDFYMDFANTAWLRFTNITSGIIFDDGVAVYVRDSTGADSVAMSHDGTDFNVTYTNTTDVNNTGATTYKYDSAVLIHDTAGGEMLTLQDTGSAGSAAAHWLQFDDSAGTRLGYVGYGSGSNGYLYINNDFHGGHVQIHAENAAGTNLTMGDFDPDNGVQFTGPSGGNCNILGGLELRVYDSGTTDYVAMSHDGTDFNITGTNTTEINCDTTLNLGTGANLVQDSATLTVTHWNAGTSYNTVSDTADWIWQLRDGVKLRVYDSGDTDYHTEYHDGTNYWSGEHTTTARIQYSFAQSRFASSVVHTFNRLTTDGGVVNIAQADTTEGTISVSGTTVTYGGAHLAFLSQLPSNATPRRQVIPRGTVMQYVNEKAEWLFEEWEEEAPPGQPNFKRKRPVRSLNTPRRYPERASRLIKKENEQRMRSKVSDEVATKAVAGVFDMWDDDQTGDEGPWDDDFFVATTGDFVIRVTGPCEVGDLLESNGDGTARVQADDIIRSSTVAKAVQSFPGIAAGVENPELVPCQLLNG